MSIEETEQQIGTLTRPEDLKGSLAYLFRTETGGGLVKVHVTRRNDRYSVYIEISSLDISGGVGEALLLCWV